MNYLNGVKNELKPTNFDTEAIENLCKSIAETELIVPVVGNFSAGKSSLLNSLLGEKILSEDIVPTTGIATELRFSPKEYSEWINKDGEIEAETGFFEKILSLQLFLRKFPEKRFF